MRIITGKAKGTKLFTLEGKDTRPTAERTKEAVFSNLQFDIEGRVVLDLFSGSGQMGLEALSRGARMAYMVDGSRKAVEIIKRNAEKTRLTQDCRIFCEDAIAFLGGKGALESFDIVFLDPPYDSDLIDRALSALAENGSVKNTSYIICESSKFDILSEKNAKRYKIIKQMKHGVAHVMIMQLQEDI